MNGDRASPVGGRRGAVLLDARPAAARRTDTPDDWQPDEDDRDPVADLIAELLGTDELENIPTLEPLIDDVLFRDSVARMWGESGAFKSFMAVDFAASVGTGMDWHGKSVHQGLVIYLVAEGGAGIRKRVRAWEQHHGRKMTGVKFLPRPVQVRSPEWAVLIEVCRRLNPVLVVVDTQARVTVGVEENSATEMGVVLHLVDQLRTAGQACVLLVHHSGLSGERGRGSTAIKGGMQTELGVSRSGKTLANIRVTLKTTKQKDDEELEDLVFALERIELKGEAKPDGTPVSSIVLVPAPGFGVIPGSVEDAIAKLDAAGIPASLGRDNTRLEASKKGVVLPGNDILAAAVRRRKERQKTVLEAQDRSTFQTCPGDQDSLGIFADQTCPGQVEDSTGQAESGPVLVPPALRAGQVGQPGPGGCPDCGWPIDSQAHEDQCGEAS